MIEQINFPDGWDTRELGEVASIISGYTFSSNNFQDEGVPLLKIENVSNDYFLFDDYLSEDIFENTKEKYKLNGDEVLVALSGATTGATTRYQLDEPALLNQRVASIQADGENINNNYLYRLLKSPLFTEKVESWKRGGGQANIRLGDIRGLNIPVPPLDEQERIVEAVEDRLERVGRLEKSVENVGRLADEYEDSFVTSLMLDSMGGYSGELPSDEDLPNNWSMSKISEVTSVNGNYTYPEDEFPEKEFNYISVSEVDGGTGRIVDSQQLLGKECSTRARRKISEDDVILSTVRPYLKAFALVPVEYDGAIASTAFAVLTAEDNIEPEYLYRAVRSPLFVNQLKSKQKGASYPEVRLSEVKESVIPVPPKENQMEIVKKLDKIDFGLLEKSVSDVEDLFEEYRSSILAHAFQGDIDY